MEMELKNMVPGQLLRVIGGTHKGAAGRVRSVQAEKGVVIVQIGAKFRTIKAENVEAMHG